jgi:hypothetical protein
MKLVHTPNGYKIIKSIKNPQIKHATHLVPDGGMQLHNRYLCQGCCDTTLEKIVWRKKEVTCKRCLQIIGEKEICLQCGYIVDDWVAIENPADSDDWIMKVWLSMGMKNGDIVCSECYFK